MTAPRDPNFPQEIPAIPPPRHPSYPAAEPRAPEATAGDDGSALARDALAADGLPGNSASPADPAAIAAGAPWTEADTFAGDSQPREIAPEPSGPEPSAPSTGPSQASPSGHNRGPLPPLGPNATVDDLRYLALGQGNGAAVRRPEAPPQPEAEPWTDSDLANLEDPLPPPSPEPQPPYLSRRQAPAMPGDPGGDRRVPPAEDVWADTEIPYQPKELGVVDQLLLLLADGVALWKKGLRWVRSQLPADLQRQLSDEVMTAIALGVVVLWLALWNPLGAGDRAVAPAPRPSMTAAAPADELDRFAAAPGEAARSKEPEPEPAPAVPEPTPEQGLIADIQARVSRISRSYGAGLIQSVEVDLPRSTLGVNLAEAWYGLLPQQQDEIAQDIYAQAQGLTLERLQLRDPDGVVVARNPVVGPTMVVLKRLRQPGSESGADAGPAAGT